jgi:hypothetical protein
MSSLYGYFCHNYDIYCGLPLFLFLMWLIMFTLLYICYYGYRVFVFVLALVSFPPHKFVCQSHCRKLETTNVE